MRLHTRGLGMLMAAVLVPLLLTGCPVAPPRPPPAAPRMIPPPPAPGPDRGALQQRRNATTETFNRKDAVGHAAIYLPNGELITETGEVIDGRAAIEKATTRLFEENPGMQVTGTVTREQFLTPDVVLQDGTWRFEMRKDGGPAEGRYTQVWVFRDGQWFLASHRSWVPLKAE